MKKRLTKIISDKLQFSLSPDELSSFINSIDHIYSEEFLSDRIVLNLHRILDADHYFSNYLHELKSFQIYFEVIYKIGAFSNYLTDIVVRNPEYLSWCLSTKTLYEDLSSESIINELSVVVSTFKSFERRINSLIRFKRRFLLKIGLRDILGIADIEKIMFEYSILTRAIIKTALDLAIDNNKTKFEVDKISVDYCLLALGKLGGNELNYSSDVDLIFFYEKETLLSKKINTSDFFENVLKTFIDICSSQREEGYLYRTDFRLRPDGKYSPLCRSFDYYLLYYESRGREWEKQMLLKSSLICGSTKLYSKFTDRIQNFVFPRSLLASPREVIYRFRENYLAIHDQEKNIKHFKGGIRDIEFSIQALQLLNGGNNPELRTPNTLHAISKLSELNFITSQNSKKMNSAYKFLRRIENYLQLMDDKQKHQLPDDKESYRNLVHFMKLGERKKFVKELTTHRHNVKSFYDSILGTEKTKNKTFDSIKFQNSETALAHLHKLKFGSTLTTETFYNDKISREFDKISNNLLSYLKKSSPPDKTLSNLTKIITSSKFPSFWYDLLQQNEFFNSILTICDMSDTLTAKLSLDRELRDFVLGGKIFLTVEDAIQFRHFDYSELKLLDFYLAFNFLLKKIDATEVSASLINFFDNSIQRVVEESISEKINTPEFIIFGMGSYGSKELTFNSDLDVIFVADLKNNDHEIDQNMFIKILKLVRKRFSQRQFFEIDSRLRPEGKSSQLVWDINQFEIYVLKRMRVWELQAYTKARLIYGSEQLFLRVKQILEKKLTQFEEQILCDEINSNLQKIKSSSISPSKDSIDLKITDGGILDIQFLIQFLLLTRTKEVIQSDSTTEQLIIKLKKIKSLTAETCRYLIKNYNLLRSFVLFGQLTSERKKPLLNLTGEQIVLVQKYFKLSSNDNVISFLERILRQNLQIKEKLLN